jgi:hypothetical protein
VSQVVLKWDSKCVEAVYSRVSVEGGVRSRGGAIDYRTHESDVEYHYLIRE